MTDVIWHRHHMVPKHAGGTDEPSNLLKCNPAMHAMMHRIRYEETGDKYDYIAWKSLLKQMTYNEAQHEANRESGRRVMNALSSEEQSRRGKLQAQYWEVTYPSGETETIRSMADFAKEHGLCKSAMTKVSIGKRPSHKGFKCRRLGRYV